MGKVRTPKGPSQALPKGRNPQITYPDEGVTGWLYDMQWVYRNAEMFDCTEGQRGARKMFKEEYAKFMLTMQKEEERYKGTRAQVQTEQVEKLVEELLREWER